MPAGPLLDFATARALRACKPALRAAGFYLPERLEIETIQIA